MNINPILRLSFLIFITLIGFFSLVILVNGHSSFNKEANDLKRDLSLAQVQNANFRTEAERKIDDEFRSSEGLESMERINSGNNLRAAQPNKEGNNNDQQRRPSTGIVAY